MSSYRLEGKTAAEWREEAEDARRRTALLDTPDVIVWDGDPVVGQHVSYALSGWWGNATGSGTYLGVALDEGDGAAMHYFVLGEINGGPQRCHGILAAAGTPTTTDLTPTALIRKALGE